jgi:hypothetical protein
VQGALTPAQVVELKAGADRYGADNSHLRAVKSFSCPLFVLFGECENR